MTIYLLERKKPLFVPLQAARPRVVITDGYHYTKPLEMALQHNYVYYFNVGCIIEDEHLFFGLMLLALFYTAGLTSDLILLKALSFGPLLYFLYVYYKNRNSFLQFKQATTL